MQKDKKEPYVYQPYGALTDPDHASFGRLWGVSINTPFATIKGLTKTEAEVVCHALESLTKEITFGSYVNAWDNGIDRKVKGRYIQEKRVIGGNKEYKYHQILIDDPDDILDTTISDFENVELRI